jgi:twinkle protein
MTERIINLQTKREYIIDLKNINGENAMPCPECSGDRKKKSAKSFSWDGQKGIGNCLHCNARFGKKLDGAYRPSEQQKPVYARPEWRNITDLEDDILKFFTDRGISQRTVNQAKISQGRTFFPQLEKEAKCIEFNYFRYSELVNVKYRGPKKSFKLYKDAELIFFNLDSMKEHDYVIITEGEMDALSYMEVGYESVISVPNGAAGKGQQRLTYLDNCIDLFDNVETIFIATDDDEPGRMLQEELARRLGKIKCRKVSFFGHKDANELLMTDKLALTDTIMQSEAYPIEGVITVDNLADDIWRLKREGLKPGCDISIPSFNELLTFDPGYLTVVTGIPNHGKSEFLDQIMVDLSTKHGWRFGIFSPENYPLQLHFSKIASKIIGESFNSMEDHKIIQAMDYYRDNFMYIVPKEDNSVESIIEHAIQLVKRYGINGLVIDAWNKLDHDYSSNETTYIGKQLDLIINFAHKYGVHIFVVAHPTKMQRDKGNGPYLVPTLYDMAGSAHFFNKSHNGISVYRHFFEDGTSSPEVFVQKVKFKHWGRQGSVSLQYDIDSGRFYQPGYKQEGNVLAKTGTQSTINQEVQL